MEENKEIILENNTDILNQEKDTTLENETTDILIYSSPKTGGNTLQINLIVGGYNVYYTHSREFFTTPFPGQNNSISLEKYIELL